MQNILKKAKIKEENFGTCSSETSWATTKDNGILESINPTTEEILSRVYCANTKDLETVTQTATKAFQQWREVPAPKRGEIVRQIGEALRQHKDILGHLVTLEMGKSLQEGLGEVQEMIDMADFVVGQSRMLYGKTMHSERKHHRMYEQWHPLGPVGVITAFNFPVAVWAWNALLAAVCGNTILWKPSSKTPLCAIAVQHICNDVMRENKLTGIFNLVISNDQNVKDKFIDDPRLPLISFTGSSHTGANVAERVAKRMGKTILECSGNNAIILDRTTDLELALPSIVFGAIGTAGQRCTSTRRLIVHQSIDEEIVLQLSQAYKKVTIGDPLDSKNLMGPLIDNVAITNYENAISEIESCQGKIIYGGKKLDRQGYFVEPTLVLAENDWPIVQQETFAPILYVMKYKDFEHAIEIQNGVKQGLSSALFTRDVQHAEMFLSATGSDCGIANINIGTSGAEIGGAFGGEKATGGGREAGSDAWKAYMRRQTSTINWSKELPLAQGIRFRFEK